MTTDLIPHTTNGIGVPDGPGSFYCPGDDADDPHPARRLLPDGPKPWRCPSHHHAPGSVESRGDHEPLQDLGSSRTPPQVTPHGVSDQPAHPKERPMSTTLTRADADRLAERILDAVDRQLPGNRDRMLALLADGNGPVNVTTLDDGRLLVTLSGIPLLDVDPADLHPRLD